MRLVKIAAAVLGGLLVLAMAGILAVAWLFDPNDYKETLAAEFERRTGRTLVIGRDLALEYLPWLAVETGGIVVGNAPGFSDRELARIETLAARVELLPLVRGEVRLGTIVVEGLELNLETDAAGRGNWMLEAAAAPAESASAPAAADTGARGLETLEVDGLRVRDGTVTYRALGTDRDWRLDELSVTTGAYRAGAAVEIEAAFRFADTSTGLRAAIAAEGALEHAGSNLTLRDWRTELDVAVPDAFAAAGEARVGALEWRHAGELTTRDARLSGWVETAALGGARRDVAAAWPSARLDPATGTLSMDSLTASLDGLEARATLAAESLLEAGRLGGAITVGPAPLTQVLRALSIAPPAHVDAATLGEAELSSGFTLTLEPFALELETASARALGVAATGRARIGGEPLVAGRVDVAAFAPSPALRALLAPYVPEGVALEAFETLALAAELEARPGAIGLRDLRGEALGATLTGRADIAFGDRGVSASGRLASSPISPRAFESAFGGLLTDTVDRRELGPLAFDAGFDYDGAGDALVLDPLGIEIFGLEAAGSLTARALSTAPVYTGRARVAPFAPRALMRRFGQVPPETSDPAALEQADIETRFEITAENGRFDDLVLRLDDSRITGELTVEDFRDPAYSFALAVDRLDADRYMAPSADEAAPGERTAGDLALDGEALDVLELSGRVEIGELRLAGLSFSGVATSLEVGARMFRLDEAAAELYGGRFDGAFGVDARGETPTMSLTGRAERLDLAPLIRDLTGDEASFSGRGDFDLALSGAGATVTDNLRSATGTLDFAMRDGAIEGFDLGRTLCSAYNATQRLPRPPEADAARTRYELLRGTADVSDGVARSPDLLARAPFMDVTGTGSVDIVEQTLDYALEAKLTAPIGIPRCESMNGLVGDSIPLTLRGTVESPQIRPDFGEILRRRVRDRATDGLEERLRERLRDLL